MTDAPVSEKARAYATTLRTMLYRAHPDMPSYDADVALSVLANFEAEVRREVVEQCAKVAERTHAPFTAIAIRAILDGEAGR